MGTLGYDPFGDLAFFGPEAQEAERALEIMRAVRSGDVVALARAGDAPHAEAPAEYAEEPEPRRMAKAKELVQMNRRLLAENRRLRARLDGAMQQIAELRQALACQRA